MTRRRSISHAPFRLPHSALRVLPLLLAVLPVTAQGAPLDRRIPGAVDRGLDWLAHQQINSGADAGCFATSTPPSSAITSLCVMAFLARGYTPGEGPYGDVINRGIDFVLTHQQPNGLLSASPNVAAMYDHGISTVMLCEVCGMLAPDRQARAKVAIANAIQLILEAQRVPKPANEAGGWRYTPGSSDSDISVTGWQLMALRGAANAGAAIPRPAIDAAIAFILRRAVPGGGFSYQGNADPNLARTGVGVVSLSLLGKHDTPEALAGGDYLLRHPIRGDDPQFFYYAVYYVAQAAYQLGGRYTPAIYDPLCDTLIRLQREDGRWSTSAGEGTQVGDTYPTAMAILALCVPYHYLPIYQR